MLIHVDILTLLVTDFAEAVHVELADKRGEVFMFEVFGEYFLGKFGDTLYTEGVSGRSPANNKLYCLILRQLNGTSTISNSLLINKGSC